jgi:hypothetical protein
MAGIRRGMVRRALPVLLVLVGTLMAASPLVARAATGGYPPPVPVDTHCSVAASVAVGSTVTVGLSTPFAGGAAVTLTLNGVADGSVNAPANGLLSLSLVVTDPPHLSINGQKEQPINSGTNVITATGSSPTGSTNTCTVQLQVAGNTPALAASGASSSGPARSMGAAMNFPVTLAFTGAETAALLLAGLVLVAFGLVLVVYGRRRPAHLPTA